MSEEPVSGETPQRALFLSRMEYADGADKILAMAQHEVAIFDPDFAEYRLESPRRIELLNQFMRKDRNNRLRIAVHAPEQVIRHCPRLLGLLNLYSANMLIYRTTGEAARAQDCFVLIDRLHVARRPVAAQGRGVLILHDPREGLLMHGRFLEIWDSSEPGVNASTSGL